LEEVKRVEFQYGVILVRTKRFQSIMDRLGRQRVTRPIGWALLYAMPVAAGIGLFIFLSQLTVFFSPLRPEVGTTIRGMTPLVYLGLPGLNPYLPLVDGWISLVVAMILHEGAHGIVARSLGLPVKSSGLLFFLFVPIGAFVDVDEDAMRATRSRNSGRVLAAGAGVNLVVGIVALLLLFGVVATMVPAANGLGVEQVSVGSPAANAKIQPGDFITAIDGIHYSDPSLIPESSWYRPGNVINLTIWRDGATEQISNVTLATNPANKSLGFLGITDASSSSLQALVSQYVGSFLTRPVLYLCIPTFPQCAGAVPFSGSLSALYTSSYGESLVPLATLLYWFFFLNFNLAVFNSLPIYPLDGGQAFRIGIKWLWSTRGRTLSDDASTKISVAATFLVLAAVFSVPLAAYLGLI
jgi:membrane-associated protease RseP (regulator of RpoE activity)